MATVVLGMAAAGMLIGLGLLARLLRDGLVQTAHLALRDSGET